MNKLYLASFLAAMLQLTMASSQPIQIQQPFSEIHSTKAKDLTAPFIGISVAVPLTKLLKAKSQRKLIEPYKNPVTNRIEERSEKVRAEPSVTSLQQKNEAMLQGATVSFPTTPTQPIWTKDDLFSNPNARLIGDKPYTSDGCAAYSCYYECQGYSEDPTAYAHNEYVGHECDQVVLVNGHVYTLRDYTVDYSGCTPPDNPTDPPGGGGGDMFSGAASPGQYPIKQWDDRCQFSSDIWNRSVGSDSEWFGVITKYGDYLITQQQGPSGGQVYGLYRYAGQTYYYYPADGATESPFLGAVRSGQYFFVPIVATVHTHTPCIHDGTDGVSQPVSSDDINLASTYPNANHYVIGCDGTVAKYDGGGGNYYDRSNCTTMY